MISRRNLLLPGQSLLEAAILHNVSPWTYVIANSLPGTWGALPGDVLHLPGQSGSAGENSGPGALPEAISALKLTPSSMLQGDVAEIVITGTVGISLTGSLTGHQLHFFSSSPGSYTSLQGIHAMTEPGIYSLQLTGTLPSGAPYFGAAFSFAQAVLISPGNYPFDPVLPVRPGNHRSGCNRPRRRTVGCTNGHCYPAKTLGGHIYQSGPGALQRMLAFALWQPPLIQWQRLHLLPHRVGFLRRCRD